MLHVNRGTIAVPRRDPANWDVRLDEEVDFPVGEDLLDAVRQSDPTNRYFQSTAIRRFAESRPDPDTEDPKGLRCTGVTSPRARAG